MHGRHESSPYKPAQTPILAEVSFIHSAAPMESPAHLQRSHTLANVLDFAEGRSLGLGSLVALGGQPSALPLSLGQLLRGAGRWTHLGAIPQRGGSS